MARRPDGSIDCWPPRLRDSSDNSAMLFRSGGSRHRFGIGSVSIPQAGGINSAKRNLFLFALFANGGLQRVADAGTITGVLSRSGGSRFFQSIRDLSSALLD